MTSNEQNIRNIIGKYTHDFRDMKQSESELEAMIINILYDLTDNCEMYPHIFLNLKSFQDRCKVCHGEGYTSQYHSFPCTNCKGTGLINQTNK